jgi:hypothetical protein
MPRRVFQKINQQWGPEDRCVCGQNEHKTTTFWSLRPDPEATATDAFQQTWMKQGMYLFPPWKFVLKAIQVIKKRC